LWHIGTGDPLIKIRCYVKNPDFLEITVNAYRYLTGGVTWVWKRDSGSHNSAKYVFGRNNFYVYHRLSLDPDGWSDTGVQKWTEALNLAVNYKQLVFSNGFYQQMGGFNPSGVLDPTNYEDVIPYTAFNQTDYNGLICAKNTIKGWISFKMGGTGSHVWLSAEQAFNIKGVERLDNHTIRIVSCSSFSENTYVPIFQLMDYSSGVSPRSVHTFVEGCGPGTWDVSFMAYNGVAVDITAYGVNLRVLCMVVGVA
jgi:hypothetical protein